MEAVAWYWIDDRTLMVLCDDMQWRKLENLYIAGISFDGLDTDSSEECEITMGHRWSGQEQKPAASHLPSGLPEPPCL
jgi:hypothetical protein